MVHPENNLNLRQPLLIIFSPSSEDRVFQMQLEQLDSVKVAFRDVHLHVAEIFEQGRSRLDETEMPSDQCQCLRSRFSSLPGRFKAYLVGSDAEVHLISEDCISWQELLMRIENISSFQAPAH